MEHMKFLTFGTSLHKMKHPILYSDEKKIVFYLHRQNTVYFLSMVIPSHLALKKDRCGGL